MKRYFRLISLLSIFALAFNVSAKADPGNTHPSGLNAKEFNKYWKVESEGPYLRLRVRK